MSCPDDAITELARGTAAPGDLAGRLRGLIRASISLMAAVDSDEVVDRILGAGTTLFPCEGCSLALHDETTDELIFFAMAGEAKTEPFRIPADQGVAGHTFRTGEPILS